MRYAVLAPWRRDVRRHRLKPGLRAEALRLIAWIGIISLYAFAGCGTTDPVAPPAGMRPLQLIVSGDTRGWIVPCGCTSNQSGGLLRRGEYIFRRREDAEVVYLEAGGAPGGTSPYDILKFEGILKGELAMGLAAHNLGRPEVLLGPQTLARISRELNVPFVSANVRDAAGKPLVERSRLIATAAGKLLVVGVTSPEEAGKGIAIGDPREAVLAVLADQPPAHDWLVVLAWLPEAGLRELAAGIPEAHLVIGGPTGQSVPPTRIGPSLIAAASNKGKFLMELDAPQSRSSGEWTGRVVEMSEQFADDARQKDNLAEFRRILAERDLPAVETGFVPPLAGGWPRGYAVAGTDRCRDCHDVDDRHWAESAHAHAWDVLTSQGAHVDAYCQQCHTTGFGQPGGFVSAKRSRSRTQVGCEACHGPSRSHADDPQTRTPLVARDQCVRCHDPENSPRFEFEAYWKIIEHGK